MEQLVSAVAEYTHSNVTVCCLLHGDIVWILVVLADLWVEVKSYFGRYFQLQFKDCLLYIHQIKCLKN